MRIPRFIACPECHSADLSPAPVADPLPAPFDSKTGILCSECSRCFPVVDGIYVLWSDQLKKIHLSDVSENSDIEQRVKKANIQIYDDVSDDYGEHHDGSQPYVLTQLFQKAIANDFRETNRENQDSIVVDVGCATGHGLDVGSTGFTSTVGVDISLENLRHVVAKGHTAVLADAERLPFVADSVDLITCFATLHHFPKPEHFIIDSSRVLRPGGVVLIAGEPTSAAMRMGPIAKAVWNARKPVYRFLSRYSRRFYMHRDRDQQSLNDLAECNRTSGGFAPEVIETYLEQGGFSSRKIFYGTDPSHFKRFAVPPWQQLVLKSLSLQNPLRVSNWMNLSAVARKEKAQVSN